MHEFVLCGGADEARAGDPARSTSPSACSTTAFTRRRSTSRCSSRRRCWSSRPRPRRARRSTRSPTAIAEILREAREDPEIARTAPTRRRCAGWTRPARRGARCIRQPLIATGRRASERAPAHLLRDPAHGRKHLGNYIGAITQYVAGQERGEAVYCIVDLHAITVEYDPAELRERSTTRPRSCSRRGWTPAAACSSARATCSSTPSSRGCWARSPRTATSSACTSSRTRRAKQRELVSAGLLLLPGAAGRGRARLPHRRGAGRRRPAPAHRADARHRDPLQQPVRRARSSSCPSTASRRSARGSWTCRTPTRKMSTSNASEGGPSTCSTSLERDRQEAQTAYQKRGRPVRVPQFTRSLEPCGWCGFPEIGAFASGQRQTSST